MSFYTSETKQQCVARKHKATNDEEVNGRARHGTQIGKTNATPREMGDVVVLGWGGGGAWCIVARACVCGGAPFPVQL